jgi:ferredoxin
VVSDSFCDGLGACLAVCPEGALTIEEREAKEFDEQAAAKAHQIQIAPARGKSEPTQSSQPSSWPIQMRLVRPWAPHLKGASLLVAADCTAFAYPAIQQDFLKGRVALVGCPKLDETGPFVDKLAEILLANEIRDITVLHMTVPCCAQLDRLVAEAVKRSGIGVPWRSFVVGIEGTLTSD